MVPSTHTTDAAELQHVVQVILHQQPNSHLEKVLTIAGIGSMGDLLVLSKNQLESSQYDNAGTLTNLTLGEYGKLWSLVLFSAFCKQEGAPMVPGDWNNVTKDQFDEFCMGASWMMVQDLASGTRRHLPSPSTGTSPSTPLSVFK